MTATSLVSPGRSASPGSSGSQPNPMVSRFCHWTSSPRVTWAAVAGALSVIAGAVAASQVSDMLTTAKIAMLTGITEVHHG
jgi:uncharacterized membrane protein HdeD (DUF308 family)